MSDLVGHRQHRDRSRLGKSEADEDVLHLL
jgi:hypothetical protein